MRLFRKIVVALAVINFHAAPASANCADIGRGAKANHAALVAAKDIYKEEFSRASRQSPAQSPKQAVQFLTEGIASTDKMKRAMDNTIDALVQAQTQGCFGRDADKWSETIAKFKQESNELGKTRALFIQQRAEILAKWSGNPTPPTSSSQSEGLKKYMETVQREAKSEFEGAKGQKAIEICNGKYGVRERVKDGQDVARLYGAKKAMDWTECVVDTMYPTK